MNKIDELRIELDKLYDDIYLQMYLIEDNVMLDNLFNILERIKNTKNNLTYTDIDSIDKNKICKNCKEYINVDGYMYCNLSYYVDYYEGYTFEPKEYDYCSRFTSI
jgi:hypothetical protein